MKKKSKVIFQSKKIKSYNQSKMSKVWILLEIHQNIKKKDINWGYELSEYGEQQKDKNQR
jgi:hypothetical protein